MFSGHYYWTFCQFGTYYLSQVINGLNRLFKFCAWNFQGGVGKRSNTNQSKDLRDLNLPRIKAKSCIVVKLNQDKWHSDQSWLMWSVCLDCFNYLNWINLDTFVPRQVQKYTPQIMLRNPNYSSAKYRGHSTPFVLFPLKWKSNQSAAESNLLEDTSIQWLWSCFHPHWLLIFYFSSF